VVPRSPSLPAARGFRKSAATAPTRDDLGSRTVARAVTHQLGGSVNLDWRAEGLVCTIKAPSAQVAKVVASHCRPLAPAGRA